jgi:hypothetical protein
MVGLIACCAGCLWGDNPDHSSLLQKIRIPPMFCGPDSIQCDLMVIERPLGDPYLNDQLWLSTDNTAMGLENKAILDDNGFCVGQVIGMNPDQLQKLLACERYWAAVPGTGRIMVPAGRSKTLELSPPMRVCSFQIKTDAGTQDVEVDSGQCVLRIEPSLASEGRIKLKFTPLVVYGQVGPQFETAPKEFCVSMEFKRPCKTYDRLGWDLTVSPNQFVVIGTHFDDRADETAPQTLGSQFFLRDNGKQFMQRILVLRAMRGRETEFGSTALADQMTPLGAGPPPVPAAMIIDDP